MVKINFGLLRSRCYNYNLSQQDYGENTIVDTMKDMDNLREEMYMK